MEQGFGPKFSRVAAAACFLLFLGLLDYAFGLRTLLGALLLFSFFVLLASFALPHSVFVRRLVRTVARVLDLEGLLEWLEARFENPRKL